MRPQSGSPDLGQGVTFSIPQFGDFFHDMVCRTTLSSFHSSPLLTPIQVLPTPLPTPPPGRRRKLREPGDDEPDFDDLVSFPANGYNPDGTGGPLDPTNAEFDGFPANQHFYNLVDAFGNRLVEGVSPVPVGQGFTFSPHPPVFYRNFVRYCEWPGNRLFQSVKFDVNGNPLDEYDDLVPVWLTKFCLPPNKVTGFKRLVGQEVPLEGYGPLQECPIFDIETTLDEAKDTRHVNLAHQRHGFGLFHNPPPGAFAVPPPPVPPAPVGSPSDYQSSGSGIDVDTAGTFVHSWPGGPHGPFGVFNHAHGGIHFAALNTDPDPVVDISRELKAIVDGPQTPKPAQPPIDIWNKLRLTIVSVK